MEFALGSPLAAIEPPLSWWGLTLAALMLIVRLDAVVAFLNGHILSLTRVALQVFGSVVLAALFGPVWWEMWAYEGWSATPVWLSMIYQYFVGEPYWSIKTEMIVTLCAVFSLSVLAVNFAVILWKLRAVEGTTDGLKEFLAWSESEADEMQVGDNTGADLR